MKPSNLLQASQFVCPNCHGQLQADDPALICPQCAISFPVADGIADFSGGHYYDEFDDDQSLTEVQSIGLEHEVSGTRSRIEQYYLPRLHRAHPNDSPRVLDCGCGNGLSVDLLIDAGIDAWGNDLSRLRRWQWSERSNRHRLSVADGASLPFPDRFFDVVISSGVLEHVGVEEHGGADYSVAPLSTRDQLREAFLRELIRVTRTNGRLWLDFPNGAFPIDFWHGCDAGAARWHARDEGFLPKVREIRSLVERIDRSARVHPVSPAGRLRFQQVSRHAYGKLLAPMVRLFLASMRCPGLRWLAGSVFNPYLVIEIDRS